MDVSIRLSLQGGHHWEFVCDEDDPMVFGLVSGLPGSTLNSSLPSDGLIQIEARDGRRLFLSRSSLVAVAIHRVRSRVAADGGCFFTATPFVMRTDVFERAAIEQLLAGRVIPSSTPKSALQDIAVDPEAANGLIRLLSDARNYLMPERNLETHLDFGIHRSAKSASFQLSLRRKSPRLLDFILSLTPTDASSSGLMVSLPDRWSGATAPAEAPARSLTLGFNTALIFPTAKDLDVLDVHVAGKAATPVLISGSLCEGSAVGAS
jgi:hypothetical protein